MCNRILRLRTEYREGCEFHYIEQILKSKDRRIAEAAAVLDINRKTLVGKNEEDQPVTDQIVRRTGRSMFTFQGRLRWSIGHAMHCVP